MIFGKKKTDGARSPVPSFHLEGDGGIFGTELFFSGVRGISAMTDEYIELNLRNGVICIEGRRLLLTIYENRSAEIKGFVHRMNITYKRAKGERSE